jgi:hypothetical protein
MKHDPQDVAESLDDDATGADAVTSDQVATKFPEDHPHGVQFSDADVTDESFAERSLQELREVSDDDIDERDADR